MGTTSRAFNDGRVARVIRQALSRRRTPAFHLTALYRSESNGEGVVLWLSRELFLRFVAAPSRL
jgi:hypothetical protein